MKQPYSTLSIDWEDFGQLYTKYHHGKVTPPLGNAIERQTNIILDVLDETSNKATFFILGILAAYKPNLVKKIASSGHEIAIHGHNHEAMYKLNAKTARQDLEDSIKTVTDITGQPVYGYRAPFFSLDKTNLYLLEILSELGLVYDSSVFPKKMSRYGIDGFKQEDTWYKLPNNQDIVELPLTMVNYGGRLWPVAGGGYIRLMPEFLVSKVFRDLNLNNQHSMIYMHPYEFDTHPIDVASNYPIGVHYSRSKVSILNFRWNLFRNSVRGKVKMLLEQNQFTTCIQRATYVKNNGNGPELLGC